MKGSRETTLQGNGAITGTVRTGRDDRMGRAEGEGGIESRVSGTGQKTTTIKKLKERKTDEGGKVKNGLEVK